MPRSGGEDARRQFFDRLRSRDLARPNGARRADGVRPRGGAPGRIQDSPAGQGRQTLPSPQPGFPGTPGGDGSRGGLAGLAIGTASVAGGAADGHARHGGPGEHGYRGGGGTRHGHRGHHRHHRHHWFHYWYYGYPHLCHLWRYTWKYYWHCFDLYYRPYYWYCGWRGYSGAYSSRPAYSTLYSPYYSPEAFPAQPCGATLEQAWSLLSGGLPADAYDAFDCLVESNPADGLGLTGLGLAAAALGQDEQAAKLLRAVARDDPAALLYVPAGEQLDAVLGELADRYDARVRAAYADLDGLFMVATLHFLLGKDAAAYYAIDVAETLGDRDASVRNLRTMIENAREE